MLTLCVSVFAGRLIAQCGSLTNPSTTWTASSGDWSTAGNWGTGLPSSTINTCLLNGTSGSPVTTTISSAVNAGSLQLGASNTLTVNDGKSLTVSGSQIVNAGAITLNAFSSSTALILNASTVTLSGAGTLTLGGVFNSNSQISGAFFLGPTLVNQSTIQGAGQIGGSASGTGLVLNNSGTVNAIGSLTVDTGFNTTNTGLMEATGGLLTLKGSYTNTGGTIQGTGGFVDISTAQITGGTLTGGITSNGSILDGVTISSGSTVSLGSGSTALENTITNNGTIALSGSAVLRGGTLTGTGSVVGAGQIGDQFTGMTNNGTINANQVLGTLTVGAPQSLFGGSVTNTGLIEATSGGTLKLIGTINNTGGTIQAVSTSTPPSTVDISAAQINGGTLTAIGGNPLQQGGIVQNGTGAVLNGVTISSGTTISLGNGSTTTLQGTITNNGIISPNLLPATSNTLLINGAVTLTGSGDLSLDNSTIGSMPGFTSNSLLNDTNHTIGGAGQIGTGNLSLTNNGAINAAGGTLTVQASGTNTGLMEATLGGRLALAGGFNNTGGTILAAGGFYFSSSVVDISSAYIGGGTLSTTTVNGQFGAATGSIVQNGSAAVLDTVTISSGSTVSLGAGSTTTLRGAITNNGTVALTGPSDITSLSIQGAVTLTGSGSLTLNGVSLFISASDLTGDSLLNDTNHTIQGAGQIQGAELIGGLTLTNNGTINANAFSSLTLRAPVFGFGSWTNTGLLEATGPGRLVLSGAFDNTGGTIAGATGTVDISAAQITGGTLAGSVIAQGNSAILNGVTISSGSTVSLGNGSSTALQGTITNNGTLALNSTTSNTNLVLSGNVTLTGSGALTMANGKSSMEGLEFSTNTLLNDTSHTIQGAGLIGISGGGFTLTNQGTINANQSGGTLTVSTGNTVTNGGTLEATGGGKLVLQDNVDNSNGTLQAAAGSKMEVATLTNFSGGTLTGGTYNVYGTAAAAGTLQIDQLGTAGGEIVRNAATILLDGPNSTVTDAAGLDALTAWAANEAAGTFTVQDGRNFNTSAALFSNDGFMLVGTGTIFSVGSGLNPFDQDGGTLINNGTIMASQFTVSGGMVEGSGEVIADFSVVGGTVKPGDSPGTMTVQGNYTQSASAALEIQIAGLVAGSQYDVLDVTGTINLNGTLQLVAINGFVPSLGETFLVVQGYASRTGTFSVIDTSGLNLPLDWFVQVLYDQGPSFNDVEVLITTPEAGTCGLMVLGLVLVAGLRRRRADPSAKMTSGPTRQYRRRIEPALLNL